MKFCESCRFIFTFWRKSVVVGPSSNLTPISMSDIKHFKDVYTAEKAGTDMPKKVVRTA